MKKRLISLLLAVAMMVAVVPVSVFAEGESTIPLNINSNGKPDVTNIKPNPPNPHDAGKKVYTGTGWSYEIHPNNQDYLHIDKGYLFDLTNEPAVKCYRVENYGEIQGGVFDPCNWVDSLGVHPGYVENFGTISGGVYNGIENFGNISGGVYNGAVRFAKGNGQISDPEIKGGIFCGDVVYGSSLNNPDNPDDTSYTTFGTISGGIFANDPRTENFRPEKNVYTLAVTDGLKIVTIQHDSQSVAVSLDKIFVLADTVTESKPLTLTLNDGTSETLTSATSKTLHKTLFIETNGKPNIDGMVHTSFSGSTYHSDTWGYDTSDSLELFSNFSGSVGPNPVKCDVKNAGTITGGVFEEMVSSYSSQRGTIQGGIFLGTVAADQNITGGVFVHDQVSGVHTVSSPAELGKIKTITLGNDTVTLDEPVDSFHFGGQPTNLSVTLEDGTVYHIDPSKEADGTVTLEPKPEEPDYYTVIVEGGEARNEHGDILDSEVALTAGEKITLKLLDETQGEMVFSHWDVNNNDTDLADELAKTGFDKTAHETTFTMPAHNLTLTAKYRMPDEDAPQDDSFLMTAAAVTGGAVLTGLVVWQGYNIFSQVYLNAHLPEGTAIPTNRQQLALLLWNTAGQPEASATSYVFPDVADPDVQTAARWATEQGLFKARKDGTFAPTDSVTTGQVYRAWQKVK